MSAAICSCKLLALKTSLWFAFCLQNDYYASMYLLSVPISFVYVLQYISFTKVISSWHLNHLIYSGWHHHWKMFLHDVSSLRINILKALQIRNSSAGDMWPSSNNAVSLDGVSLVFR